MYYDYIIYKCKRVFNCSWKFFFRSYAFFDDNLNENEDDLNNNENKDVLVRNESIFVDEKIENNLKRKNIENKNENKKTIKEKIISVLKDVLKLIKNKIFLLSIIKRSIITSFYK